MKFEAKILKNFDLAKNKFKDTAKMPFMILK
jgi:hypothetical protein